MLYSHYFIDDLKDRADLVRRGVLVLFCALLLVINIAGQDVAKAVVVSEFGFVPCGHFLSQVDLFIHELKENRNDRAVAIISPRSPNRHPFPWLRVTLSRFENAGMEDRLQLFVGPQSITINTQFWRIPPGASPPEIDGTLWTTSERDTTKPFIFGSEDENEICPTFVPRKLAELVADNPGSRVHFVVKRGDRHSIGTKGFSEYWIERLIEAGIPRDRIRIFYSKSEHGLTYGEFWFVPAKK